MQYIDHGDDDLDAAVDEFVDALIDDLDGFAAFSNLPPPGNCTWERHRQLQAPVHVLCDINNRGRVCEAGMTGCINLNQRIQRNARCIEARHRINRECYAGGDREHRIAENDARRALSKCQRLWRGQRCQQRPGNRRIPRIFG
jgi:hypothetical protein